MNTPDQLRTIVKKMRENGMPVQAFIVNSAADEMEALMKDAEAFRLIVSHRLTIKVDELDSDVEVFHRGECLAWPPIHHCKTDSERTAVAREAVHSAIAAMEKQP